MTTVHYVLWPHCNANEGDNDHSSPCMEMGPRTSYNQIQGSIMCFLWSRELMTGRKFLGPNASVKSPMCHFLPGPGRLDSPPPPLPQQVKYFEPARLAPPQFRKIGGSNTRSPDYKAALLTTTPRLPIGKCNFLFVLKFAITRRCSITRRFSFSCDHPFN